MRRNAVTQKAKARGSGVVAPLIVALLLFVVGASAALAQETQLGGKLRGGDQVVVPAGETVEGDLYASGGLVRVEGRVEGDLLAAAGQVQVAGQVTGDVMAAGGSIDISGRVGVMSGRRAGSSPSADL